MPVIGRRTMPFISVVSTSLCEADDSRCYYPREIQSTTTDGGGGMLQYSGWLISAVLLRLRAFVVGTDLGMDGLDGLDDLDGSQVHMLGQWDKREESEAGEEEKIPALQDDSGNRRRRRGLPPLEQSGVFGRFGQQRHQSATDWANVFSEGGFVLGAGWPLAQRKTTQTEAQNAETAGA